MHHESVEVDARSFKTSAVVRIVDALVLELFSGLEGFLLLTHNLFCGKNLRVSCKVSLLDFFDTFLVFLVQLIKFLVIHLSNSGPLVCLISLDALGFEVCANNLIHKLGCASCWVSYFNYLLVWVDILSSAHVDLGVSCQVIHASVQGLDKLFAVCIRLL